MREEQTEDVLTNLMFKSKADFEENKIVLTSDCKLNYNKVLDNPKSQEYTYVDALANLEELNELLRKRITEKNKHYNYFLDDSEDPHSSKPISRQEYEKYCGFLNTGIFAYTTRNTWTKGKEFFFVEKGCLMKITHFYDDLIYADVQHHDRTGLMKLE